MISTQSQNIEQIAESTKNTLIHSFKQFTQEQNTQIPDVFVVQFVENYLNKDRTFSSEYIFNWFGKQKCARYDTFTNAIVQIIPGCLYQTRSRVDLDQDLQQKKHGGQNKKIYDISYKGMKMLAMHCDPQTALYYLELDTILYQYLEQKEKYIMQLQHNETLKQQEQELYQSKLKTQSIKINDIDIQMYGDLENPLFDCQQILIQLLGYTKSGECWFYKQNKKNDKYIREVYQPPSESTLRIQEGVQKKYFTEIGLYRCLFTSQKPIAVEFQEQIALLLKDIRMGNIKLQVQKECQYTNSMKFKSNQIVEFITKVSDLEGQVKLLQENDIKHKKVIEQTKKTLTIYEQRVDDKVFVRSTTRQRDISNERNSKSPNRYIRKASLDNKRITLNIIKTQDIISSDDRKFSVKQHIDTHNRDKLLNERIQKPDLSNVTLTSINEDHFNEIEGKI